MAAPYRDDTDALTAELVALLERLETIDAAREELRGLEGERDDVLRALADVRARLARTAEAPSLLDTLRIASPCTASWDEMTGDERTRFCAKCEKQVHNLSALPRDEAEAFLRSLTTSACVRVYRRTDGTVMTDDCPVGVTRARRKRVALTVVGGGLLAAGALLATREEEPLSTLTAQMPARLSLPTMRPQAAPVGLPGQYATMGFFSPPVQRAPLESPAIQALRETLTRERDPGRRRKLEAEIQRIRDGADDWPGSSY